MDATLTLDICDLGECCSKHRAARLLRCEEIKAQRGSAKQPCSQVGAAAVVAPNLLEPQFTASSLKVAWAKGITYIHTHGDWLY